METWRGLRRPMDSRRGVADSRRSSESRRFIVAAVDGWNRLYCKGQRVGCGSWMVLRKWIGQRDRGAQRIEAAQGNSSHEKRARELGIHRDGKESGSSYNHKTVLKWEPVLRGGKKSIESGCDRSRHQRPVMVWRARLIQT
jgi:hypothetical protein